MRAFLVIFLLSALAEAHVQSFFTRHAIAADNSNPTGRRLLRRTIEGNEVSDEFCAPDENNTCDWMGYVMFLMTIVVPFLVLAILSLLFIPIFLCGRFVCNCCGGKEPGDGILCSDSYEWTGYSRKEILLHKAFVTVMAVAVFGGVIAGAVGNQNLSSGLLVVLNAIEDAGTTVIERATTVATSLQALEFTQDAGDELAAGLEGAAELEANAKGLKADIIMYDGYRFQAIMVTLASPFALLVIAVGLGWLNVKVMSICCALLLLLTLVIVWVSVAIHWLVAVVLDDVCIEVDALLEGADSGEDNGPVGILLGCATEGEGPFDSFKAVAEEGMAKAANSTCAAVDSACFGGADCPNCNASDIGSLPEEYIRDPPVIGARIKIKDCATNVSCTMQSEAQDIVDGVETYLAYEAILASIFELLSCDFVKELVDTVQEALCVTVTTAFFSIKNGQLAIAIFVCFAVVGLIRGQKRFISPATAAVSPEDHKAYEYGDYDDDDEYEMEDAKGY